MYIVCERKTELNSDFVSLKVLKQITGVVTTLCVIINRICNYFSLFDYLLPEWQIMPPRLITSSR